MTSESDLRESLLATEDGCTTLGSNNVTYCGITKIWEPRQWVGNQTVAYERFVETPLVIATFIYGASFLLYAFYGRRTHLLFVANIKNIPHSLNFLGVCQKVVTKCMSNKEAALERTFILFWFVRPAVFMLYDHTDVSFDFQYFYRLEFLTENLLDPYIMRNKNVNNGILAFAILGLVKTMIIGLLNIYVNGKSWDRFKELSDLPEENRKLIEGLKNGTFMIVSAAISLTAFIFEDGAELFLEYFYVDKYSTKKDWLVLINSTVMAVFAFLIMILRFKKVVSRVVKVLKKKASENDHFYLYLTLPIHFLALSKVLRAVACWLQGYYGTIPEDCLVVLDGALIQTPFKLGCLSEIDYAILIAMVLSILGVLGQIIILCGYLKQQLKKNKEEKERKGKY